MVIVIRADVSQGDYVGQFVRRYTVDGPIVAIVFFVPVADPEKQIPLDLVVAIDVETVQTRLQIRYRFAVDTRACTSSP